MRILTPILFAMTGVATIFGADITGVVMDSDKNPLPGASVELASLADSTNRSFTFVDENGIYNFKKVKPGRYALRASTVGMEPFSTNVEVADSDSVVSIKNIILAESGIDLQETVVTGIRTAVTAKQDTVEFNAGSYHTSPNASVGDLLKKLPGVEVSKDGSITSGGKSITKIYVDGKEFFSDDPTMATKNLPSDMVEKVQVIDKKSDLAKLTGVDDGEEETVINLTVKKNMKNGWFGTVGAGGGTDGRYEGNFNISSFKDNNQISIVGGGNNINDMGFNDMGRGRFMNFGPQGGITSSQRFGINFNVGKTEDFRVGGNVFYTHTQRKAESYSETQHLFPDSISMASNGSRSTDEGHAVNGNFRLQWKIDENNTIDFRPSFYYNTRRSLLNDSTRLHSGDLLSQLVNRTINHKANQGDSYSISGDFIYSHKFASRPGRSFSTQIRYSYSNTIERTTSLSDLEYLLKQEDDETLYRYLDNKSWSNSGNVRLTWTEPLGDVKRGNFLTFAYNINMNLSNADKITYNLPNALLPDVVDVNSIPTFTNPPDGALESDSLSNRFRNRFITQDLRVGYKKVSSAYNLEAGLSFSPSYTKSTDLINYERNIPSRTVWNVAPFLRFRYKFDKTTSLRLNYRARTSNPSTKQLQPVPDVSDPMNIIIGNPSLKPSFSQTVMGHFNSFNTESQRSIMAMAMGSVTLNSIVSRTISDPTTGGRTTTYTNSNGNFNVMGMFMLTQPFRNRNWRINANMRVSYSSAAGYINGDFNRSGNLNLAPRAGITFSNSFLQITVNPDYAFSMATNSLPRQANQYIHTYGFNADASVYLPFGLEFNTDVTYSSSKGYTQGFDTSEWLWNAKLSYSVLRDKSLTFSVRAYDILGQNKNVSRSVSANMIVDNRYNDLTRYVMFGVSYTFNTIKNKQKNRDGMMPGEMPPPGERRGERPMGPPPGVIGGGTHRGPGGF